MARATGTELFLKLHFFLKLFCPPTYMLLRKSITHKLILPVLFASLPCSQNKTCFKCYHRWTFHSHLHKLGTTLPVDKPRKRLQCMNVCTRTFSAQESACWSGGPVDTRRGVYGVALFSQLKSVKREGCHGWACIDVSRSNLHERSQTPPFRRLVTEQARRTDLRV